MFKIIILFFYIIFMIGCSIDNSYFSKKNFSNQDVKLDEIFSDFMDRNDNYPYLYTYKQIRWRWLGNLQLKFENKIKKICENEQGQILSMKEFLNKYGLIKTDFPDRCIGKYPNRKIAEEIFPYGGGTLPKLKLCVVDKKPIPRVLFAFGSDYNTYNGTRIREIVCIPNSNTWDNNFKYSHSIYQMKKRQKEEREIKEKELEKKKDKDLEIYNKLLEKKEIIVNNIINLSNPYKSKFKISKNGKFYIQLSKPFLNDKKICGTFFVANITPNLNLGKKYSNYPNDFGGKVVFKNIMCFNFEKKPQYMDYYINKYEGYEYLFEVAPIYNKLIILHNVKISTFCFDIKHMDLFATRNSFYCINGECYPLQSFLENLEMNFPKNRNLIIKLPNIECDLWKYYSSPNYATKLLIIDPLSHKVKSILYLEDHL